MDTDITVILANKNRDKTRLDNCLDSLSKQTYPVKVVLVDYGSNPIIIEEEKELLLKYPNVTLVEVTRHTRVFNKCRALNIGIKHANTKFIVSSDVDCIFAHDFAMNVLLVLQEKDKSIVLCQKIDLDQNGASMDFHEPSASGSCIGITKEWLEKVHGYDEYYTYWGREDNDLVNRAISDGYEVVWITDRTKLYHQWHVPAVQETLEQNDWYYRIQNKPLVRNPNEWGET